MSETVDPPSNRVNVDRRTFQLAEGEIHDARATAQLIWMWIRDWKAERPYLREQFNTIEDLLDGISRRIEKDKEWRDKRFFKIMGYERKGFQ